MKTIPILIILFIFCDLLIKRNKNINQLFLVNLVNLILVNFLVALSLCQ